MTKTKIIIYGLVHAFAVSVYTFAVVLLMSNSERFLNNAYPEIQGILMLMLFVISASITGSLVVGRPVVMYLNGDKKNAFLFFVSIVLWMMFIFLGFFVFTFLSL